MALSDLQQEVNSTCPHFACIDLGTNTVLLLITQQQPDGQLLEVHQEQRFPRLGEGLQQSGRIKPEKMALTLGYLQDYLAIAQSYQVQWLKLVGTAALREAANGGEFCQEVERNLGVPVTLISGEEEARFAFLGALSNKKNLTGRTLVVDIGGGSSEFIWGQNGELADAVSLPMGSVKLTERFRLGEKTSSKQAQQAVAVVADVLASARQHLPASVEQIVGTAGTFTTLAAIHLQLHDYDCRKIDGTPLTQEQIENIFQKLRRLSAPARLALPGITAGREDVILGGVILVREVLRFWQKPSVLISDRGLRFGVILAEYLASQK